MDLVFLPRPRKLTPIPGNYSFFPGRLILLQAPQPQGLLFTARKLQQALPDSANLRWELAAGWAVPATQVGLSLRVDANAVPQPQGYRLLITPDGMSITGHDRAGVFYGACTLIEILRQAQKNRLPCLDIEDWPDFPARGVMLDISRDRVPQMSTLYELVDRLVGWKVNQLQLYTEHTFAYRNHAEVWAHASPMTGSEILALDAYCRENFIELVPNQNSFGHMERWLKHPRYAPLAEIHGEFQAPWGSMQGPFGLAPLHPGSLELLRGLYDELLPHFTSCQFNVGCDETVDLGQGQTREACQRLGAGRVYLDFLHKIYAEVTRRGRTMQFWGDIINNDPALVPELPRDAIGLLWGYEADFPFDLQAEHFASARLPFYACPGTSSWNSLAGRTQNALGNLLSAAENGLKFGACGYLNTDWGDRGHWQVPPVSSLGFAAGAAYSWCLEANRSLDLVTAAGLHAFDDPTASVARAWYDLGNVYLKGGEYIHNGSTLFWSLQKPLAWSAAHPGWDAAAVQECEDAISQALLPLKDQQMERPDRDLVLDEIQHTARMLRHACQRARLARESDPTRRTALKSKMWIDLQELISQHRSLWLARCRPGGYPDSRKRLEAMIADYQ